MEEFTKMLRDEADVRLSIIGPWAADLVALENKFRIDVSVVLVSLPYRTIRSTPKQHVVVKQFPVGNDSKYFHDPARASCRLKSGGHSSAGQKWAFFFFRLLLSGEGGLLP